MKWYGHLFKASVLYSRAGIATQIILSAEKDLFKRVFLISPSLFKVSE